MLLLLVLLFGGQVAQDPLLVPAVRVAPFEKAGSRAPLALLNRCRANDLYHVDLAEGRRLPHCLVERDEALQLFIVTAKASILLAVGFARFARWPLWDVGVLKVAFAKRLANAHPAVVR